MNSKLTHVHNWPELVRQADWSPLAMAKKCGVSIRRLERYFLKTFGKCPRCWVAEQRHHQAVELLRDGSSVKETATILGYKHANNFSRKFPGIRAKVAETPKRPPSQARLSQHDR